MTLKELIQLILTLTLATIYKINTDIEIKRYEEEMKRQGKFPL